MRNHRIIRGIQLVIATASFCGALPAQTPKAILTLFQYGPEFHGLKDATVEAKLSDYVSSTLASKFHRPFQSGISTAEPDRKSTRLNSSHLGISYAVFCLKKK